MCSRLTVLRLHEPTSQAAFEVWITIGNIEHPSRLDDYPSLRIVRISPAALAAGVETSQQGSVLVRVISAAKTVASGKVSRPKGQAGRRRFARPCSRKSEDSLDAAGREAGPPPVSESNRLLPFAQQILRHVGQRFSYCIAVGGTPTNFAASLVEQRGALERTAFSACQRVPAPW